METVNNLASAASRAIWGEGEGQNKENTNEAQTGSNESGGQEPMSGQTGNVESGEPYDKGNTEPSNTKTDSTNEPSTTDTSNKDTSNTEPTQPSGKNMGNPSADPPKETTSETGDPASAQQNTQKHQGADRPGEGPDSGESQKIKDTKKEAEEAAAVDVSGPGPKTLEEKSKEGGAAGAGKKDDDDDDGPQKESHGEGTGEKYVKSSGMKVDGGDFDASAPGAGKEADRLLEEKGIHHEVGASGSSKTDESESTDKKDDGKEGKPSLKEKIKAKLHKN